MGVDVEIQQHLEAFEGRILAAMHLGTESLRAEMREGQESFRAEMREGQEEMRGSYESLRAEMQAGDRETRVLVEAVHHDVRVVAEGVVMLREEMHRCFKEQERNFDRRMGSVETAIRHQSVRLQDLERRVDVIEERDR